MAKPKAAYTKRQGTVTSKAAARQEERVDLATADTDDEKVAAAGDQTLNDRSAPSGGGAGSAPVILGGLALLGGAAAAAAAAKELASANKTGKTIKTVVKPVVEEEPAEEAKKPISSTKIDLTPEAKVASSDLYANWREWAERAGEYVGSIKRFSELLITRSFLPTRLHGGKRGFKGLRIRPNSYGRSYYESNE